MIFSRLGFSGDNKNRKTIDDNMIPLINIVFLLLIFFMVSAQISAISGANIDPPLTSSEEKNKQDLTAVVIEIKSRDSVYVNNKKISIAQLAVHLAGGSVASVAVRGDKTLAAKDLDVVLKALRDANVKNIVLFAKQGRMTP